MKTYVLDRLERVFYVVGIPGGQEQHDLAQVLTGKSSKPDHIASRNVMYVERVGSSGYGKADLEKAMRSRSERRAEEVERTYTDVDMEVSKKRRKK